MFENCIHGDTANINNISKLSNYFRKCRKVNIVGQGDPLGIVQSEI